MNQSAETEQAQPQAEDTPKSEASQAPPPPGSAPRPADDKQATVDGLAGGTIVAGSVTSTKVHEVELDLGGGRVGVISQRYWDVDPAVDLTSECKPGEVINAAVLVRQDHKGRIVLSRLWALQQIAWADIARSAAADQPVTGTVTAVVKGGLACDVGVRGFIPASLVDVEPVADLQELVGQQVQCKVVEADQNSGRLVLSRKAVRRAEQRRAARQLLEELQPGEEREGTVAELQDFGVLVDLGGLRGLVHVSEITWQRIHHPSEVLSVGDEVSVRVKSVNKPKQRVSLTMKLTADPLADLEAGQRMVGQVTRLEDYGAFVSLGEGLEGLVHISELSEYRVRHPSEVVLPDEEVWVKVLSVDRKRRRVELSIAQAVIAD